ncbi:MULTISPECIES: rhomboid family intramembrane serine protease [Dyella]|uniref:Rhomboid family intramembrane serine protease n=2 Tax=Dyella TaxID=231454 RepID=A0A4R0YZC3_9GAMM|nr:MULTISPECIES: rhomboid family intramembrane serine protease [Dyella]TBR40010.1 rhomboid family intramembrane serine protease [Dyella terrae]TCI12408.1 rhomboid family intramembrane serine protease [Dyella soli]
MPTNLAPVTRNLLIANVIVYLLQMWKPAMLAPFALWPLGSGAFEPWQIVTSAFMHSGLPHIFFNMFALYMFGGQIERLFGARNFTIYYFTCAIVASVLQLLVLRYIEQDFQTPTLGASGAVFGLLLAFGMMYPRERLILFPVPIPIPAWLFVTGYGLIELFSGVTGWAPGVAHFAHLGGMLGGFLLIQYWRGKFPIKPSRQLLR